jgi:formate-dependent nitrite reductase membrane component NrfD
MVWQRGKSEVNAHGSEISTVSAKFEILLVIPGIVVGLYSRIGVFDP